MVVGHICWVSTDRIVAVDIDLLPLIHRQHIMEEAHRPIWHTDLIRDRTLARIHNDMHRIITTYHTLTRSKCLCKSLWSDDRLIVISNRMVSIVMYFGYIVPQELATVTLIACIDDVA